MLYDTSRGEIASQPKTETIWKFSLFFKYFFEHRLFFNTYMLSIYFYKFRLTGSFESINENTCVLL